MHNLTFWRLCSERNLHRVWDVAYDGYNGGKGMSILKMHQGADEHYSIDDTAQKFVEQQNNLTSDYQGKDIIAVLLKEKINHIPSPMPFGALSGVGSASQVMTDELVTREGDIKSIIKRFHDHVGDKEYDALTTQFQALNNKLQIVPASFNAVGASVASTQNNATSCRLMYQGTIEVYNEANMEIFRSVGCGHHGPDYPGVASVRNGKSLLQTAAPMLRMAPAPAPGPAPVPKPKEVAGAREQRFVVRAGDEV